MKNLAAFFLSAFVVSASPIAQVELTNAGSPLIAVSNLTMNGTTYSGVYIGPYTMEMNGVTMPALCIDFSDESHLNTSFNADVTAVGSSNLSNTYWPTYGTEYEEEAYILNQILKPGSDRIDWQEAAWEITSYGIVDSSYIAKYGDNSFIDAALSGYSGMNFAGFEIVSDTVQHGEQEFLVDPTPEPGSALLLGLGLLVGAGVLASRSRFRGQQSSY